MPMGTGPDTSPRAPGRRAGGGVRAACGTRRQAGRQAGGRAGGRAAGRQAGRHLQVVDGGPLLLDALQVLPRESCIGLGRLLLLLQEQEGRANDRRRAAGGREAAAVAAADRPAPHLAGCRQRPSDASPARGPAGEVATAWQCAAQRAGVAIGHLVNARCRAVENSVART